MARASRVTALLFASTAALAAAYQTGCTKAPEAEETLCTPGAYVFCRCQDRREGSKECSADGRSFAACTCGTSVELPDLNPDGDTDFQPVEAVPPDGGLAIPEACAGKLAIIEGALVPDVSPASDIYSFAYAGGGEWSGGSSKGPVLRGTPAGAVVGDTLVAIWPSKYETVVWTKFAAGQTTLVAPAQVADAFTKTPPSVVASGDGATMYYLATDGLPRYATYSSSAGWSASSSPILPKPGDAAQKSGPVAEIAGGKHVFGYAGASGAVAVRTEGPQGWESAGPATAVPSAQAGTQTPALAALKDSPNDLLMVYQGADGVLRWTTRTALTLAWSSPALVDTAATADGPPGLVAMPDGRVVLAWRAMGGAPMFSVFSAGKWSRPGAILPNLRLASAPMIARGKCAGVADIALVDDAGAVVLALFDGTTWTGPYPIPAPVKMTYAGVGEVP